MSQQNLDLRASIRMVRKRKKLFGGIVAVGLLAGAAYAAITPSLLSSTTLVVVSGAPVSITNSAASSTTTSTSLDTQIVIAGSTPVLTAALPNVNPPTTSVQALDSRISIAAVNTSDVMSITATGKTAPEAIDTANAVANSYVTYVNKSTNLAVHVVAKVIEPAATASGGKLPEHVGMYAILGALIGAIIGFVIALTLSRSDRRLVQRDEIANSIAAPVLLSLSVERPSDPPSWVRLLEDYEPDAVQAYGLSKLLQELGAADFGTNGNARSVTVLSLASDPAALALGPQLAAFASARGIPTALVVGPQQDMNVAATLRTACAAGTQITAGRGKPLRLMVTEDSQLGQLRVALTVLVLVVDGRQPRMPDVPRTSVTVLGVSAGGVTAEQLALAATAAAAAGHDIYGILVANPDPGDQTTGRIPRLTPVRRALPTRVNGLATENKR